MVVEREAGGGTGSARRRRERRLRSMLRHERMSVAMALAESTHYSAPRGQKMARAGGERETNYTATLRKMLPPRDGFCGTLWDICLRLLLMSLCRRWWTSCRTLSISSPHSRLILSRLSKCPRSCLSMSLCARPCALRSWWNSWWKYRRRILLFVTADCGAARRHSSSWWWRLRSWSSRFSSRTQFNSVVLVLQETHF